MIILLADRDPRVFDRTITTHDGDIKSLGARGAQPPTACHPIRMRRIQGTQIVVYRNSLFCGKRPKYSVVHLPSRYTVGIFSVVTSACKRPFLYGSIFFCRQLCCKRIYRGFQITRCVFVV